MSKQVQGYLGSLMEKREKLILEHQKSESIFQEQIAKIEAEIMRCKASWKKLVED